MQNGIETRGNSTYQRDEAGFLLANFCYIMVDHEEPFILPSQTQDVFFVDDDQNPQWKIMMHKEVRSICYAMDSVIKSNNIDDDVTWLNIALLTPPTHEGACLVGAKELSTKESIVANELI